MAQSIPELQNYEWLKTKYVIEQLSSVEIGKTLGCRATTVLKALDRHNIPRIKDRPRKSKNFKCTELNNKEWLRSKYEDEQLNSYEIAEIAGTNQRSVMRALGFHGIESRSISDSKKLQYVNNPVKSRYENLNNEVWLRHKYEREKLSCRQIGELCGSTGTNVLSWLKHFGIQARSHIEARSLVELKSSYDLLNNRNWLHDQYIKNGKSTKEIAKLVTAQTANSARQALIKFGIPVRNTSDGLTHNRENDGFIINHDVIEGGLLGDAGLNGWNFDSDRSYPYYSRKNKFLDHIILNAKLLFGHKWMEPISLSYKKEYDRNYFNLRSLSYKELKPYQDRWYPKWNNFKKVIPEDIDPTPVMILHWFLDDGTAYVRKGYGRRSKQIIITLCTECFSRDNQQMLVDKIQDKYKIRCRVKPYNQGTGWRIGFPQSQADAFYDLVGPPPVPSLAYKWK